MNDWLHSLPLAWMALVVFGATYIVGALIQAIVAGLAVGERARSFKAVSPGMLPPLGIIFGLFVAFTAAQVWNDTDRANAAVAREASALRSVVVLAASLPRDAELRLRSLVRSYIEETTASEWPLMAQGAATLKISPATLTDALQLTLSLPSSTPGQQIAQRQITSALGEALEARRQRILVSRSEVNATKWACLILQAICALFAIAVVHSDNRLASALAIGAFATGVAASLLLILSHDRPFVGTIAVRPDALMQVMPADVKQ
jgi:hypothetical protein